MPVFRLLGLVPFLIVSCAPTDLGRECVLMRLGPNGPEAILEGEIDTGKDVVSFGAVECDHSVCVRSSSAPRTMPRDAPARGRCSTFCENDSTQCASAMSHVSLRCRALVLDETTLAALRARDPD